jgi:serine protease Do
MGFVSSSWAQDHKDEKDAIAALEAELAWAQSDDDGDEPQVFSMYIHGGGGFLGITTEEVTTEVVQRLNLKEERGALITSVVSDSAAAKAGLQKDDVIVRWNGTPVESASQLRRHISETPGGRTVRLDVARNGRDMDIRVTLGKRSDRQITREFRDKIDKETRERVRESMDKAREALKNQDWGAHVWSFSSRGRMGVTLQDLTPQLAEYFGLKDRTGVLISSVRDDSPASRAGLKAGDIMVALDGEKIEDSGDAIRIVSKKDEGPVDVRIVRDRREMNLTVTLDKKEKEKSYLPAPEAGAFNQLAPNIRLRVPRVMEIPSTPVRPLKRIRVSPGVI